jgi:hypothetical protein
VLDDETRAEIVRYNALDIELYDRVVREFPQAETAEQNELSGLPPARRLRRIAGGRR